MTRLLDRTLPGTLFLVLACSSPSALAQDATTAPPPAPCSSEQHRQFDFWVGRWDVTANDQPAGTNEITLAHGDCVLKENWTSAQGNFTGSSLNLYDAATDRWHQTWVDTTGNLLELNGGLQDGSMVLQGERPTQEGGMSLQRITWTPNEDGSVRQHWETSTDGGDSWSTVFDGLYEKAAP